jgi:hypothetical protein
VPGREDAAARVRLCWQVGRFGFAPDSPTERARIADFGDLVRCQAAQVVDERIAERLGQVGIERASPLPDLRVFLIAGRSASDGPI